MDGKTAIANSSISPLVARMKRAAAPPDGGCRLGDNGRRSGASTRLSGSAIGTGVRGGVQGYAGNRSILTAARTSGPYCGFTMASRAGAGCHRVFNGARHGPGAPQWRPPGRMRRPAIAG